MSGRRIPVLVGVGTAMRREEDHTKALEPLDLMLEAVRAAGEDCGTPAVLGEVDRIAVPRGRWRYRNPAGAIAADMGADRAETVLSTVGVLQQSLIARACEDIADGRIDSAIVVGADAGFRILRAKIAGQFAEERQQDTDPDVLLEPAEELRHEAEVQAGLNMAVGLYALADSARRTAHGHGIRAHRDRLGAMYARFSAIAADNPDAWVREQKTAQGISEAGPRNPMQAFPYTRSHCSTWNVDQAAALLLCSEDKADALGIAQSRRVYPVTSAEANHMTALSARRDPGRCIGAEVAAKALFQEARIAPEEIDLFEMYSCFPVAVDCFAQAARVPEEKDLTITGGMPFAGGPYNNYFFQATVKAAELLRAGAGKTALLSCVSGIMTKQAFALWSTEPPLRGFARLDLTDQVAARSEQVAVVGDFTGQGTVLCSTILYERGHNPKAILLIDTAPDQRALVTCEDAGVVRSLEEEEWAGRMVEAANGRVIA